MRAPGFSADLAAHRSASAAPRVGGAPALASGEPGRPT
jgi:hypothetical protein